MSDFYKKSVYTVQVSKQTEKMSFSRRTKESRREREENWAMKIRQVPKVACLVATSPSVGARRLLYDRIM